MYNYFLPIYPPNPADSMSAEVANELIIAKLISKVCDVVKLRQLDNVDKNN